MATIFNSFCIEKRGFVNPEDVIKKLPDFPEVCITSFSEKIVKDFVEKNKTKIIEHIYTSNGAIPIYELEYQNKKIGIVLSRVGAPACVAGLEEIIAMGAKKIIQFGCCGVLDQYAVGDKIIIPSAAVRDEGTSYHYIPESEEILADRHSTDILEDCLNRLGIPYVKGKTWTTDAIYRETISRIEERKRQGCVVVEMECSASLAVAQFRNISIIQFLFGADNLDSERWEQRDLAEYGIQCSDQYMKIALECAVNF